MKTFNLYHLEDGKWVPQEPVKAVSRRDAAASVRKLSGRKEGTWKIRCPEAEAVAA